MKEKNQTRRVTSSSHTYHTRIFFHKNSIYAHTWSSKIINPKKWWPYGFSFINMMIIIDMIWSKSGHIDPNMNHYFTSRWFIITLAKKKKKKNTRQCDQLWMARLYNFLLLTIILRKEGNNLHGPCLFQRMVEFIISLSVWLCKFQSNIRIDRSIWIFFFFH